MKIAGVTPFLIAPQRSADGWSEGQIVILVKLETTCGLIGWGEAYALDKRQRAQAHMIEALGAALIELDDATPRRFLHLIGASMSDKHPSIDYAAAVSAIEIGLWDLLGKSLGQPVHALLGGGIRDHIPLYANAWDAPLQAADAVAVRCGQMRAEGYAAVKIYPLRRATLAEAEDCVRLTREAIGPEADLMLDFAIAKDPALALRAAQLFEAYDPYWVEEPVAGDYLEHMAEIRAKTSTRIVTGERQSGLAHYRNVLTARAADVLNPDIAGAGGILEMLSIGALAEAHGVAISPHSWNSTTVAYMAMLHVCAVMPNATYAELYYDYLELGQRYARCDSQIINGYATLPQSPGLGVEIDESALAALLV